MMQNSKTTRCTNRKKTTEKKMKNATVTKKKRSQIFPPSLPTIPGADQYVRTRTEPTLRHPAQCKILDRHRSQRQLLIYRLCRQIQIPNRTRTSYYQNPHWKS
uniref:Uncharacterized protein n=1 Tax=Cacopsylla melanoneura TaxID=428564 RepID=A0A8D9E8J7_9HEMI